MILAKKCQTFLYLDLAKITLQILLNYFEHKKATFFYYKKQNFSKSKNSHFFKGDNPCFWSKNAIYLFDLDLVKIRLAIMLSDTAEKTLFDYEQQNFSK